MPTDNQQRRPIVSHVSVAKTQWCLATQGWFLLGWFYSSSAPRFWDRQEIQPSASRCLRRDVVMALTERVKGKKEAVANKEIVPPPFTGSFGSPLVL